MSGLIQYSFYLLSFDYSYEWSFHISTNLIPRKDTFDEELTSFTPINQDEMFFNF